MLQQPAPLSFHFIRFRTCWMALNIRSERGPATSCSVLAFMVYATATFLSGCHRETLPPNPHHPTKPSYTSLKSSTTAGELSWLNWANPPFVKQVSAFIRRSYSTRGSDKASSTVSFEIKR